MPLAQGNSYLFHVHGLHGPLPHQKTRPVLTPGDNKAYLARVLLARMTLFLLQGLNSSMTSTNQVRCKKRWCVGSGPVLLEASRCPLVSQKCCAAPRVFFRAKLHSGIFQKRSPSREVHTISRMCLREDSPKAAEGRPQKKLIVQAAPKVLGLSH